MDAAGSERATLIGHGHAAQMVLMFAATYPERVDSLVLINGFARLARDDDYPAGVPQEIHGLLTEGIEQQWGTGAMAAVLAPSIADRPGLQDWYGRVERNAAGPGTAVAMMRATLELDVREILPLVAAPTLVVQNRDNEVVRAGHGRYLAEHLPNARLLERESADHWPLPDPDLLGALEEFITGSRSEAGAERFLATVLVCDVAGSTERVAELGDERWRTLRIASRRPCAASCTRTEASSSTRPATACSRPSTGLRAIRCARHIRESVQRSGIDVRSGLHTGR